MHFSTPLWVQQLHSWIINSICDRENKVEYMWHLKNDVIYCFGILGINGCIWERKVMKMWIEFNMLRTGFNSGVLWTLWWTLRFHQKRGFLDQLNNYQKLKKTLHHGVLYQSISLRLARTLTLGFWDLPTG
jgi:hypothetical protein